MSIRDLIKSADYKNEKHIPVIELPKIITKDKPFKIEINVGKEIPHPNTTEHFISWISLYFKPTDSKNIINLGKTDFTAHGESAKGTNKGIAYTEPIAYFNIKIEEPGKLIAVCYCNIHGLWESEKEIFF